MFGIGMPELLVILVVALVVLGPQRLPELARTLGKAMAEFRRQTTDVLDEFHAHVGDDQTPVRKAAAKPQPVPDGTTPAATAAIPPGSPPKSDSGTA
jgi:sec-independent protein translocase protein TatB